MKRKLRETLAFTLAFSMLFSSSQMTAFAAEDIAEEQEILEVFEEEEPTGEILLEEDVSEEEPVFVEEESTLPEEGETILTDGGESSPKDKLTMMIYGIGSDLEREGYAYTIDICEILAGMDAALVNSTDETKTLPINLVVETGGASYNPLMSDKRDEAAKAKLRADTGRNILNDENAFKQYDDDLKKLTGGDELKFKTLFKVLTASSYPENVTSKSEIGEAIDWSKNQRWHFVPDPTDSALAQIEPAKSPVSSQNENISLVETDSNGVVKELYDFVNTTMQDYPAEQYVLVLWDHGGGPVDGFGSDERDLEVDSNGNRISSVLHGITGVDIQKTMAALKANKGDNWQSFAFAGYDACLMGSIDDVAAWTGYSRYLIASEDLEGSDGWYYTPWVYDLSVAALKKDEDPFANTQTMDALSETTGRKMVDSFCEWFNDGRGTLALFDLRTDAALNVADAMDGLSDALIDYIRYNPADAFRSFYNASKNTHMFGGIYKGMPDINAFCEKLKNELPEKESRTEEEQVIYEKANNLQSMLDSLIKYSKNTGDYRDADKLKGITQFTPYIDAAEGWKYWSIINSGSETREAYKDFMATYAAMQETGKVLYEIYDNADNKYPTDDAAIAAIEKTFEEKLKEFRISDFAQSTIDEVASELFEERLTKKDTKVVKRGSNYYSKNDHWELVDNLYQHASMQFELKDESVQNIYLGYLSDGEFEDGGCRLDRFGKDLKWFYMSAEGQDYVYPVSLLSALGDDPFTKETDIQVPAFLLSNKDMEDADQYRPVELILLDIVFEEGTVNGEVFGYSTLNENGISATSRYVGKDEFTEDQYIVPTYEYPEKLMGDSFTSMEFKNASAEFLLKKTPLKKAVFGRGVISEDSMQEMAAELANWSYDENKVLGEAKGSIKADYFIRDMFQREYFIEEFADETEGTAKATIMFYGIGSDLERNSYAASYDMTEIIAGLTAAKKTLNVEKLPINVVADLGGVSYDPTAAETEEGKTRDDKLNERQNDRLSITQNNDEFKAYNKILAELGDTETDSYDIFSALTAAVNDGAVVSDEAIDWEKNQRWELMPLSVADDKSNYCLAAAKNFYEDDNANRNTVMTQSDENGVTLELYDFVKSTMEQYPSEQYILVLWDHGGGEIQGYGVDERGSGLITSYNVTKTFEALKKDVKNWQSLSFVGYDACLMSTLQTARAWQGSAEYMIASEALEPGDGWNYVRWINALCKKAAADENDAFGKSSTMAAVTEEVGKIAVDDFVKWYVTDNKLDMGTLALIKLDRDELNNLSRATENFGAALSDYIKEKPLDAYSQIYDIRKDTVDFGTAADLRHLAYNTEREFYALANDTDDANLKKVVSAAQNLIKASDGGAPVVYWKNTGYFEDWTAQGNTQLGGISVEFPYNTNVDICWESYLDLYRKIEPATDSWRDFMGSYVAIRSAGDILRDVYGGEYANKDAAVAELRKSLDKSLTGYSVTASYGESLKSAVPEQLYDNRITSDDLHVVAINDEYYFMPRVTGNKLIDGLRQHGWLNADGIAYGLGVIPGSALDGEPGENGIKIPYYGLTNWIWIKDKNSGLIYPASVYDTFYHDDEGNTMGKTFAASIPVITFQASKNDKGETEYFRNGMVYLNVIFKDGDKQAVIESFNELDVNAPNANTRLKDADELKNLFILPIYNAYENLVQGSPVKIDFPQGKNPIPAADLVISRGEEKYGDQEKNYVSAGYYLTDKFAEEYELLEMKYRTFGFKWKNSGASTSSIWLSEGAVITKADLTPVVSVNGIDDSESTEKYGKNILGNLKIIAGEEESYLTDEGYTLGNVRYVDIILDEADLTPEKMVPGFDALSENEKASIRNSWNNEYFNLWNRGKIRINVVRSDITEDDEKSGMDSQISLTPAGDNTYSMTMVKGQTLTLGKGQWESNNTEYVTVAKTTGKIKAKKATPVAKTEEDKDLIVAVTNSAVSPAVTYMITVVTPVLYQVADNEGKSEFLPVKSINLNTADGEGNPDRVRFSLLSAEVTEGVPGNITFNVAWTSSNPKVVAVYPDEEDGSTACVVRAVSKGSARIAAWVNGKAYSCNIKVTDVYGKKTPYGIPSTFGLSAEEDGTLNDGAITVNSGSSTTLKYSSKSGFVPKKATWTYRDEEGEEIKEEDAAAYVNKSGKLVAAHQGSSTLKGVYTAKGKTITAEFTVYVVPAPAKWSTYLMKGKTETLKFYKVKNAKAEWKSSDEAVATVDNKGKVTAVATGVADITCEYNGSVYKTTVYVEEAALDTSDSRIKEGAKANTYTLTLKKGTRYLISAPSVYQKLNWKSSKASCAFVNENDIIEGRKAGKSNVTTKINGVTVKIEVIIQD